VAERLNGLRSGKARLRPTAWARRPALKGKFGSSYDCDVPLATTVFNAVGVSVCFLAWVGIILWAKHN
jgi:hypothetical protein